MTIYAQTSRTLATITDVKEIYPYYYLASSSIDSGAAPHNNASPEISPDITHNPGSRSVTVTYNGNPYIWTDVEPSLTINNNIISDTIGQLYVVECTIFSNNTYNWGPLMTSSTYAAAKAAYNNAIIAKNATDLLGGHFIYKSTNTVKQGVITTPSGAGVIQTINDDPANWGYNTWIGSNGIQLRTGEEAYTTLNNNGLILNKGGIEAGVAGQTGFIYLSTEDYPLKDTQSSPTVAGLTINNYTPTKQGTDGKISDDPAWRAVIGTNFGVLSDGSLYASNVKVDGEITATTGSISGSVTIGGTKTATTVLNDIEEAGAQVNKYISHIDDQGIKVHPYDATHGQVDTDNYAKIDSNGMEIWQKPTGASTSVKVAEFEADGAQIGQTNKTHANIYTNSFELTDSSGTTFFKVKDAVNESGNVTDTFVGDGDTKEFSLSYTASNTTYTVTQNNIVVSPTKTTTKITFSTAPALGDTIIVTYGVVDNSAKAYDLGIRKTNTINGSYSVIEGFTTTASGEHSHAEGEYTIASGNASHAEGAYATASGNVSHAEGGRLRINDNLVISNQAYGIASHAEGAGTTASGNASHAGGTGTIANAFSQTTIGKFNEKDVDKHYAFIIGNGTGYDANERSNALAVKWNGDIVSAGEFFGQLSNEEIYIEVSIGSLQSAQVYRQGNIVQLQLSVKKNSATAAGDDIFSGYTGNYWLVPKVTTTACTYYGTYTIPATFSTAGNIVLRNATNRQFAATTSNINISFTYLVDPHPFL